MRVIAGMLGFPPEDGPQFREFVEDLLEGINLPPEERETGSPGCSTTCSGRSTTTWTTRAAT